MPICPVCHDAEGQTHPAGPTAPCQGCSADGWGLVHAGPDAFDTWDAMTDNIGCLPAALPVIVVLVGFWAGVALLVTRAF